MEQPLQQTLQSQIEFYFSEFNLGRDAYLLSLMDKDGYAPLQIIAQFKRVKSITLDIELIREAISQSNLVELNEDKNKIRKKIAQVKTTAPTQRTTIVLRDIPSSQFTSQDIEKLFEKFTTKPKQVKPDIADTWFLEFEQEQQTLEALEFLRAQTLVEGKPIQARIKATAAATTDIPPPLPPVYPQRTRGNFQNRQRSNNNGKFSNERPQRNNGTASRPKVHISKQQEVPQYNQFPALSKSSLTDNAYLVSGYGADETVKKYSKEDMITMFTETMKNGSLNDGYVNTSSILCSTTPNSLVHLEQKQKDTDSQQKGQADGATSGEATNPNRPLTFAEIVITAKDQSNKVKSRSRSNSKPLTPRA